MDRAVSDRAIEIETVAATFDDGTADFDDGELRKESERDLDLNLGGSIDYANKQSRRVKFRMG